MSRLAACLTGSLLLLLAAGSMAWSEPAAPAGAANSAPAAPAPVAADATGDPAAPAAGAVKPAPKPASPAVQTAQAPAAGDQPATPPATPAPATPPAAPAPAAPAPAPAPKLDISGFVDTYFEYNFNRPPKFINNAAGMKVPIPGGIENNLRNFDFKHDEFALNAEVIETKDNWNYTRSLLFAWAIPYYHAGLRYHHVINANSGLALELVNGWNDVEDNNNSLTYGASYNTNLTKKLPLVVTYYGGPELTNDNHNWRHLVDTVLTFNQSDKMAYTLNADYAHEDRDVGSVKWWGLAGYARRQLTGRTAFVLRGEYFADSNGASTGTAQHVKEVTATYEIKGPAGLLTRAEFRYDWSNKDVFYNSSGGLKGNQPTLLLGAVYAF